MVRPTNPPIPPAELGRLARIRRDAASHRDQAARTGPNDPLGRVAWAKAYVGERHPATLAAVQAARQTGSSWRQIAAALGDDTTDPKAERRAQRRWSRRLSG